MKTSLSILFAGTPEFANVSLKALIHAGYNITAVYSQPDKPSGRGQKMAFSPVKQTALAHQLLVRQPQSLKDPVVQNEMAQLNPDLMIVAAYGLILPKSVLAIPKLGCINIHASLLPRWRGAAPIQHALLAGDKSTGISIMQMEPGLDTGPVLNAVEYIIDSNETQTSLHDKLAELGGKTLIQSLENLKEQLSQAIPQNDQHANYAHKINKNDALIDWQQSAEHIDRQIRAFHGWPVAHTKLQDKTLRIWQAQVLNNKSCQYAPGTIIQSSAQGIDIATGTGVLRLLTLQLPGQKALAVGEVINGHQSLFSMGQCLG